MNIIIIVLWLKQRKTFNMYSKTLELLYNIAVGCHNGIHKKNCVNIQILFPK